MKKYSFDEDGNRVDGRKPDEYRETKMEVGVLDEADGSAMVETGNTRVVASSIRTSEASPKTPTGIRPCSNQDAVQHGSFLSRRPNETRTKPKSKKKLA